MSDTQPSRRKFLQLFGLTAGATLIGSTALAGFVDQSEIKKLNPEQKEFMLRYGQWMDEFTEVIRNKKNGESKENHLQMIALTEKSAALQPELDGHMKDETFALIYKASIERMTKEI